MLFPQMKETIMNQEKLAKLQAQVRIGGKVGAASPRCHRDCVSLHAYRAWHKGSWKRVWGAAPRALSFAGLYLREAVLLQGSLESLL